MIRIRKKILLFYGAILVLIIFSSVVFSPIRYLFIKTVQFPVKIIDVCFEQIRSLFTLRALIFDLDRFQELKQSNDLLKIQNDELRLENNRLRKILEIQEETTYKTVVAEVIFADASNWSRGIVINKGSSSGVRRDDPVITTSGLVGKVLTVWPGAAHVLLINDSDFAAAAMLEDLREKGIVVGSLDGSCRMLYIDDNADLVLGERVITSGMESIFPKGIPIGEVTYIGKDYSGSVYLEIKPYVDINRVEMVSVIVK